MTTSFCVAALLATFLSPASPPIRQTAKLQLVPSIREHNVGIKNVRLGLARCLYSSCRVSLPGHKDKMRIGSGTVIKEDDDWYYVVSAGHVVRGAKKVSLKFYCDNFSKTMIGDVIKVTFNPDNISDDFALIRVNKKYFDKKESSRPVVIPLAPKEGEVESDQFIISAGFPYGLSVANWTGQTILEVADIIPFTPAPVQGRSGSAICDVNGTKVLGIMVRRYSYIGIAVSSDRLHSLFE